MARRDHKSWDLETYIAYAFTRPPNEVAGGACPGRHDATGPAGLAYTVASPSFPMRSGGVESPRLRSLDPLRPHEANLQSLPPVPFLDDGLEEVPIPSAFSIRLSSSI